MELQYAENFTVDYYEDGYKMLTTLPDSQRYLLVPEGQPVPQGLDEDVSILQEPLQNIYLVASGAMDMFASRGRCGSDPVLRTEAGELVHSDSKGCHGGRGYDLCRKIQ